MGTEGELEVSGLELFKLKALRSASDALRKDMLMRAEMNRWQNDGELVVEAGNGVWSRFCKALEATKP